jgi:hypothetical protein
MAVWKKILLISLALITLAVLVLLGVVLVRTVMMSMHTHSEFLTKLMDQDIDLVEDGHQMERAIRLGNALRIPTVSRNKPDAKDVKAFIELHKHLETCKF